MPFVALFTDRGKMIAYTEEPSLVEEVSRRLGGILDSPKDVVERELVEGRRRALKILADGTDE